MSDKNTSFVEDYSFSADNRLPIINPITIKIILIAVAGFLVGGARIFDAIAPFGVAFVSTVPIIYLLPCIIGTVLSTMLFINSSQVGFIVLSILFAGGLRVILQKLTSKALSFTLCALISVTAMTFGVFIKALVDFTNGFDFILLGMQIVLTGCFAYFFAIAFDALLNHKISRFLSHVQLTSIGVLTIVLICGASSFHLVNLNIGVILGVILIYVITSRFYLYGASLVSIVVSIALNLYSPTMLGFTAMLIISSFVSGLFSVSGKFLQIAAFLVITSSAYLFLGSTINLTPRIIDIFFATCVYIILPKEIFSFLDDEDTLEAEEISTELECPTTIEDINTIINIETKDVCEKLIFASDTMQDLQDNLTTISEKFLNIEYNNITSIPEAVSNVVCKNCSRNLSCWGKNYDTTIDNFSPIITRLKATGNIDEVSMPDYFLAKCCKLTRFIESINDNYNAFLIRQNVKRQVCESRAMVFEQFSSISNLLCEISKDLDSITGYDESIAKNAMTAYCELEEKPIKLSCLIDKLDRRTIEIYTDKIIQNDPEKIGKTISFITGVNYDIPEVTIVNEKTKITLCEKPKYVLDYGVEQSCFKDNTLSGDTIESFNNSKGQAFFLLSDGMGKGSRAAIDSVMTCSIMTKLLKAGFGVESSIKLLNSSLVVKSTDESLSTIDLAKIDLYTGELEIVKAGATVSYIYSEGEVTIVETESLPIGILQKPEYDSYTTTLKAGDICLLVTDGVTNSDAKGIIKDTSDEGEHGEQDKTENSWVVDSLKTLAIQKVTGEIIADTICSQAKTKAEHHQDDITVVAVRIWDNI